MPVVARYSDGPPVIAYSLCDALGRPLVERNPDAVFYAASTIKLAVLLAVMRAVDAGSVDIEENLDCPRLFASGACAPDFVVAPDDADPNYPKDGAQLSVSRLLRMMISRSSNEATNVLVDRIGLPAIAEALRKCGALVSKMERLLGDVAAADTGLTNEVSARDLTAIMRCVVGGELTTPKSTEVMRTLLSAQEHVRIGNAVPDGIDWGSKSGDVPGIEHDVAFVGDPNGSSTHYLAVCTRGYEPVQGRELIACVASALLAGRV
ncbi:serine hydrolase [Rathayibacter soli]|uniref:serine hydrolase n=1 Tax=Rathayibacter soli TaxID=3144168 RepID=UPI0027E3E01D|nr:serine hydrolase [Glaciibacter superstes]